MVATEKEKLGDSCIVLYCLVPDVKLQGACTNCRGSGAVQNAWMVEQCVEATL